MKSNDVTKLVESQQQLFEVDMSPSNLKDLANKLTGVLVGIEFELIVPDSYFDSDYENGVDYNDDDEVTMDTTIYGIVAFYKQKNSNSTEVLEKLTGNLKHDYRKWLVSLNDSSIEGLLGSEAAIDYFADWMSDNLDLDEVPYFRKHEIKHPDESDWIDAVRDCLSTDQDNLSDFVVEMIQEFAKEGDIMSQAASDLQCSYLIDEKIDRYSDLMNIAKRRFGIKIEWPFNEYRGKTSMFELGEEFGDDLGKEIEISDSYHSVSRNTDGYILEPDSSIKPDSDDDCGAEFISPPMTIDEMLKDLKKIKSWATKNKCYTNKTTGLHINVSVPNYSKSNLDYVKLALLVGDKYVLKQFGRLANTYARSALDVIASKEITANQMNELLDKLKKNVDTIASKILHSGETDKYISIRPADRYVEFRSPGGDWLDQNFDKIEDTIYRLAVALDAACNPEKFKKDFYKNLVKILDQKTKGKEIDVSEFAKYISGRITRSEYATNLLVNRMVRLKKEGYVEYLDYSKAKEKDFVVKFIENNKPQQFFIRNTSVVRNVEEAWAALKKLKPKWFKNDDVKDITIKQIGFPLKGLTEYTLMYDNPDRYISYKVLAKTLAQAKKDFLVINMLFIDRLEDAYDPVNLILTSEKKPDIAGDDSRKDVADQYVEQNEDYKIGEIYLNSYKRWFFEGEGKFRNFYYIIAKSRNEAIELMKQIDPLILSDPDMLIKMTSHDPNDYVWHRELEAQEQLIASRKEYADAYNQVQADATKNYVSYGDEAVNLNIYTARVDIDGQEYTRNVVADSQHNARQLVSQLYPDLYASGNFALHRNDRTADDNHLIMTMYKRQKKQLSQYRTFYVFNKQSHETVHVSALNKTEAAKIALQEKPFWSIIDVDVFDSPVARNKIIASNTYRIIDNLNHNERVKYISAKNEDDAIDKYIETHWNGNHPNLSSIEIEMVP